MIAQLLRLVERKLAITLLFKSQNKRSGYSMIP